MKILPSSYPFRRRHLLIPFALSVLNLLIGVLFQHNGGRMDAPMLPIITVEVLFWLQIILGIVFIYRAKGERLFVLVITFLSILIAIFCAGEAEMALINVWV